MVTDWYDDDPAPTTMATGTALPVERPGISGTLPPLLKDMFASGIATGGMCALLLNSVLPGKRR